jgi:ribosomal protein S15P/S13E
LVPLLLLLCPQVQDQICKLAKKGMTPSAIGVLLRDQHGIPQVCTVTGSKILRILKGSGLAPDIPEDLYFLIKKAVSMRKHLERNRKDKDGKFRLILIESRIHRLARYYKVQQWLRASASCHSAAVPSSSSKQGSRGVHGCCPLCCDSALSPMLVEVASGFNPGVCWWLASAAARHYQHPGCGAPGLSWTCLHIVLCTCFLTCALHPLWRGYVLHIRTSFISLFPVLAQWLLALSSAVYVLSQLAEQPVG